jgi:hypothetical protein
MLILKRASASRPSGEWSDDDFDVLADSAVVGRIMKAAAAPVFASLPRQGVSDKKKSPGAMTGARIKGGIEGRSTVLREAVHVDNPHLVCR